MNEINCIFLKDILHIIVHNSILDILNFHLMMKGSEIEYHIYFFLDVNYLPSIGNSLQK